MKTKNNFHKISLVCRLSTVLHYELCPRAYVITLFKNRVNNSLHLYGVKKFHSLRSEFHFILTPVE